MQTVNLTVTGMKCGGCEANIVEKLSALAGVERVEAHFKDNLVQVAFNAEKIDVDTLEDVIVGAGFGVE
ncbi:MAG TPA: mercuric reductase [Methylococcaceae bacterium]|nr:mercuric reductase [Methylococcaceae bacterium]